MEKGDALKYSIVVLIFVGLAAIILLVRPSPTGYAILSDYTTEADCTVAGYTWENLTEQNCTQILGCVECEEGCAIEYTEVLCEDNCTVGCGINDTACVECEEGCVTEYSEVLCEEGCLESCEECINVVIGGQCVGDICDSSHLDLCHDESDCNELADGYWYDASCHEEECTEDDDCIGDEVCTSDNTCCEPDCSGKECGNDGCGGTCGTCDSGYSCDDGSCVEESLGSGSSATTTEEENKNLLLSGQDKVLVSAGSSEEAELSVKNIGKYQLTCEVQGDWISSEQKISQLNKGEEVNIKYKVSVPAGIEAGVYSREVIVKCTGGIKEYKIIEVSVLAGEAALTGKAVSELEAKPGITGFVVGIGRGKVIAYVIFLLVLAGAVVLVWKRHAQIRGFDDLLLRGRDWFNTAILHRKKFNTRQR